MATTFSDVIAEAPDFIKLLDDAVEVAKAVQNGKFTDVVTKAASYEADVVRVYNDLKGKQ